MENLPPDVLVEILSRLGDSTDLARCRLASRTLRSLSRRVRSISVVCTPKRFRRSRAPATRDLTVPFRSIILNLLSFLSGGRDAPLRSLRLVSPRPDHNNNLFNEIDCAEDIHLTADEFLSQCLPSVARALTSLTIVDFWWPAFCGSSTALSLISDQCCSLLALEIRNAWLSVDGLKHMLNLTSLSLRDVRLDDDDDLDKIKECFPSLQILKLINLAVQLTKPMINLPDLRICHLKVVFYIFSLEVDAPNLVEFKLECGDLDCLVLEAPLLAHIDLKIDKPNVKAGRFPCLKSVKMKTSSSGCIKQLFKLGCEAVKKLELEVYNSPEKFTFLDIRSIFPNVDDLKLRSGAWTELERSFGSYGGCSDNDFKWRNLKRLTIKLLPVVIDVKFLAHALGFCIPFCEVTVLLHDFLPDSTKNLIIASCMDDFPSIKWKWESWRKCIAWDDDE